ncbi:hypothetical protein G7Y89_g6086 [Cudoniella acicularis]|uniref:SWR1-complex protein 5 n=1 Tax=Cudoniella acicularis TaxID=354080 RepID=A0A8H4RL90_9HELO|nr:hypothetical protein G7Y89_g6086 [Cudoniella acicularis]
MSADLVDATHMPPELILDDEEYASEEDSDFAPDAVPAKDDEESSDNEAEEEVKAAKPALSAKRKRGTDEEAEDAGFENSGDEAIIERGLKKQKKRGKKGKDKDGDLDDEGGEGGLVKTRSMRAAEKVEKKTALVDTSKATVDVDALWANMISGKPITPTTNPTTKSATSPRSSQSPEFNRTKPAAPLNEAKEPDEDTGMVLIKRTYNFAGKVHIEQRLVPRHSAEAKLFLSAQKTSDIPSADTSPSSPFTKPKRPLKKARRSIFEPVIENLPQRTDLHFGVRKPGEGGIGVLGTGKEKKLNTVEKSAMDWAGFVDKEGIADELDAAGKSKGAYKARQEFLARVEQKKEEETRRARGVVL